MKISILGAGSWGTALGHVLVENKHDVCLWHYNEKVVSLLSSTSTHPYLPSVKLNNSLKFTSSLDRICNFGEIMILSIPSQSVRSVLSEIPKEFNLPIISASKGIENKTGLRITEIIKQTIALDDSQIVVLSGPSHAEEVCLKYPTTLVAACENIDFARQVQKIFSNKYFRVYSGSDIVGVEIGGAAKNVIAIAAGISNGIGYGDNTMAALVTRGLEEIVRFGLEMGGNKSTFSGLSGMGDLVVTAFSPHSRNSRVGFKLGKGIKLKAILEEMQMVAEGVHTAKSIHELNRRFNIEMPICEQVYRILFEDLPPKQAILELMGRDLIDEHKI